MPSELGSVSVNVGANVRGECVGTRDRVGLSVSSARLLEDGDDVLFKLVGDVVVDPIGEGVDELTGEIDDLLRLAQSLGPQQVTSRYPSSSQSDFANPRR